MTNSEMYKAVISKATASGWNYKSDPLFEKWVCIPELSGKYIVSYGSSERHIKGTIHTILFSHSFAKAFWGQGLCKVIPLHDEFPEIAWKYHLQQAVISTNPLEYYYSFIENKNA